jgi:hypothetical protein
MSKLASGTGGTDRAALEAFVAQGDTSVPGVEMSDLNDGDILARTRENVNPNGLFQFVYIPDDGSEHVTSDWVDQEHKKKLTRQWVDGVKSAIISRAQAKISAAKEAAEEARAKQIRDEQFAEPAPIQSARSQDSRERPFVGGLGAPRQETSYQNPGNQNSLQAADPASYVEDQLDLARERLRSAEQMQSDLMREVLNARRDYDKWKALSAALGGIGDGPGSGPVGGDLLAKSEHAPVPQTRSPGGPSTSLSGGYTRR